MAGTGDVRGALQRRFTTNTVPTLSPIGQQRRQAAGDVQMVSFSTSDLEEQPKCSMEMEKEKSKESWIAEEVASRMATLACNA